MAAGEVRVEGLRELQYAFRKISVDLARDLRVELKEVAEPVRHRAEEKASSEIPNIGPNWSQMRVGVTANTVYVAPKRRRGRNRNLARPNLAVLLMDRAMQPALDESTPMIVERLDLLLGRLGGENGF